MEKYSVMQPTFLGNREKKNLPGYRTIDASKIENVFLASLGGGVFVYPLACVRVCVCFRTDGAVICMSVCVFERKQSHFTNRSLLFTQHVLFVLRDSRYQLLGVP